MWYLHGGENFDYALDSEYTLEVVNLLETIYMITRNHKPVLII